VFRCWSSDRLGFWVHREGASDRWSSETLRRSAFVLRWLFSLGRSFGRSLCRTVSAVFGQALDRVVCGGIAVADKSG